MVDTILAPLLYGESAQLIWLAAPTNSQTNVRCHGWIMDHKDEEIIGVCFGVKVLHGRFRIYLLPIKKY